MASILQRLRRWRSARRRARFLTDYQSAVSDVGLTLQAQATQSTATYVRENMAQVQSVDTWRAVHDRAIAEVSLQDGLCLEFGVYSGTTANYIAAQRDWTVNGFDSFEGLPEPWRDGYDTAAFARQTPPSVSKAVTLHTGWFADTLPQFLTQVPAGQPVAYLHIDSDLYSSARTVLTLLADRLMPGAVIVFDEYFNYTGWEDGEFRAFQEFIAETGKRYRYLTYNRTHQQVALVMC
ncbi:class I SAM-dependent methyltransferase [Aliishimia ponticola]|uniref:Class I SAM-dependent methyltransferase n=1 Tax=Aliishimia ponticola TaxID=2499833 RepID=A0A4S4N9W1_9RHOB|nr:class I SAM-dependent methyltransferase [Aliishimia ponticola]THH34868.1 class I SAM-dependent methyltransferase [Aliishimia ponticola]